MTQLASISQSALTASNPTAVRDALRNSLYPGASDASIDMVLSYCQAGGYDPLTKPVHIVPIWDKNAKGMRDTVMPGICLYRIIADRTGKYAGMDDAEFGPEIEAWGIRFPQWCKLTLYKITPAGRVPYSAKVFWLESYATASKDTDAPNSMWKKRPYGQLEKCAEAAALRRAFPEIGAQPTAEEMEGKAFIEVYAQESPAQTQKPSSRVDALKERLVEMENSRPENLDAMVAMIAASDAIKAKLVSMKNASVPADTETGEIAKPENFDALLAGIAAAPNRTALRTLKGQVMDMPEPWDKGVKSAYRERLASFGEEKQQQ